MTRRYGEAEMAKYCRHMLAMPESEQIAEVVGRKHEKDVKR